MIIMFLDDAENYNKKSNRKKTIMIPIFDTKDNDNNNRIWITPKIKRDDNSITNDDTATTTINNVIIIITAATIILWY